MKIEHVTAKNLKSHQVLDLALEEKTLLTGPNGIGKTAVADAIALALHGHLPGVKKTGQAIMGLAQADAMSAQVKVDAHTVARGWVRSAAGAVSETLMVDGIEAKGKSSDAMIHLALGYKPALWCSSTWWGLSPEQMKRQLLTRWAEELANADDLVKEEADAKAKLNQARGALKQAQTNVTSLAGTEAPAQVAASLEDLQAEAVDLDQELVAARKGNDQAIENDTKRKTLTRLLAKADEWAASLKEAKTAQARAAKEAKKAQAHMEACQKAVDEGPVAGVHSAVVQVAQAMQVELTQVLTGPLETETRNHLNIMDELLAKLLPNAEEEKAQAQAQEDLEVAKLKATNTVTIEGELAVRQVHLAEKTKEARKAKAQLEKVGPGPDPAQADLVKGLEERLKEVQTQAQAAAAIKARQQDTEKARLKLEEAHEAAMDAHQVHVKAKAQLDAFGDQVDQVLAAGCHSFLPTGEAFIDWATMQIGWEREGVKVTRAALSGGERAVFDAALGRAITGPAGLIVVEASECDAESLAKLLLHVGAHDEGQVIVLHWSTQLADSIPAPWGKIKVGQHSR